jgi:putative colanic acid biosynthesis acetyltransferase WcaF
MEYQLLNKFQLPKEFRGRSGWYVQIWWIVQSTLFKTSPHFMFTWRSFLLRLFGAKIGKNVRIRASVTITYPWKVTIGDNTWIGDDCVLYSLGEISIGSNVALAHKVYINTGGHDYTKSTFDIFSMPVIIEDQCWITNDIFIAPGVTIGRGTVVGARSTVLHNLPTGKICYGSPAKVIKDRIEII